MPTKININGTKFVGNGGDALRVVGECEVEVQNSTFENNRGEAIAIYQEAPWMREFNLPPETNPRELAELLQALREVPESERQVTATRSSLFQRWADRGLNVVALASNVAALSTHPSIKPLLERWLQS